MYNQQRTKQYVPCIKQSLFGVLIHKVRCPYLEEIHRNGLLTQNCRLVSSVHSVLVMAVNMSETSVNFCVTTRRNISESSSYIYKMYCFIISSAFRSQQILINS
jgi:hypothetical protein